MASIAPLLDKARIARSLSSDLALADLLQVSRSVVSEWRKGTKVPSEHHVCALASLAHVECSEWLLIAQAARTAGTETGKEWAALLRRFAAAAVVLLAVAGPLHAIAQEAADVSGHYAKKLAGFLRALVKPLPRANSGHRGALTTPTPISP